VIQAAMWVTWVEGHTARYLSGVCVCGCVWVCVGVWVGVGVGVCGCVGVWVGAWVQLLLVKV